jgi:DNA replication protein DnaC
MNASERCRTCCQPDTREWVEPMWLNGRILAGTGTWRSAMQDGLCPDCLTALRTRNDEHKRRFDMHARLVELGGGEKPYREFRFETFIVTPHNEAAFIAAKGFDPARQGLYLFGPSGVGKTHLAFAIARAACESHRCTEFLTPPKLLRRVRRKIPDEEQGVIDRIARADVFVLDDLGIGSDTAYARQVFQEILDARAFDYRAGLVVTSKYSLDALAAKLDDDCIPSRLAGLCRVIAVGGLDRRKA